jgi:glucose-1-phosphate cytidylyltransferase
LLKPANYLREGKSMKTVILAGGLGSRLAEETVRKPKPMVEIGGRPMLWHVMNIYAEYGHRDFIVACGYKGELIKEFFANYHLHVGDLLVDMNTGAIKTINNNGPKWQIHCIDTGLETMTGGRLLRMKPHLSNGQFMVTYGDGVANIDIEALVHFHNQHGKLATVTAVRPPARFGGLELNGDQVSSFAENSPASAGWINGGFFVFEPEVLDLIESDTTKLEAGPLTELAAQGELMAFKHRGFWKPMDTLREMQELEILWGEGDAPWTIRNQKSRK